ncbi:MAG TPA: hypothetical protein VJ808_11500 [Gemmatimonadales bacterium]|nr:hypothetical protein [Gemmatimonadales bacterium]
MAVAPAVLLGITAATAVAGTGLSIYGQLSQAQQASQAAKAQGAEQARAAQANASNVMAQAAEAARAAEFNARIAQQQAAEQRRLAALERRRASVEAGIAERQARREMGARVSAIGASGFTISGSFTDVIADAALEDEQQRLFIIADGEARARARLAGATIEEMTADEFVRQAAAERAAGARTASELLRSGAAAQSVGQDVAGAAREAGVLGAIGTGLSGVAGLGMTLGQSPTFRTLINRPSGGGSLRVPARSLAGGHFSPRVGLYGRV